MVIEKTPKEHQPEDSKNICNYRDIPRPIGRNKDKKIKVAKKNLTLKCTKLSAHLSGEQGGPSLEMFNTRLEESLQKYTTGNNLLLAERWTECFKRDFLSLMFTFYDSHLCFSFITGREKSIQVIGSGTAYLISVEPRIWGTQASSTLLLASPCAFFHMYCEVLFS